LRLDKIKKGPLNLYNSLVWMMRVVDKVLGKQIGLSIIVVATDDR
jgi:hypothetical protein